jgi:hypothetical protein
MYGQTQKGIKALTQALELNPALADDTYTKGVAAELTGQPSNLAIQALKDASHTATGDKASPAGPRMDMDSDDSEISDLSLVQSWMSFFGMNIKFFKAEARNANGEDTLISVMVYTIAAVATFMINGFFQYQQIMIFLNEELPASGTDLPPIDFNIGMLFFGILIGNVIMTPLSFYLGVGVQFLGGRLFGGSGNFKTHAYLMGLVQVPVIVISGVLSLFSLIPRIGFLAWLAGVVLLVYAIILTVRVVMAAHGLGTGQAVAAIFVVPFVLSMIGSCLAFTIGSLMLQ